MKLYNKKKSIDFSNYKVLIFDLDNTLEDYAKVKDKALVTVGNYLNKKYGISKEYFISKFNEIDLKMSHDGALKKNVKIYDRHYWFNYFFKNLNKKISKREIDVLVKMYWDIINTKAKLIPYAKSFLKSLKKNFKLVLLSDSDGHRGIKVQRIKNLKLDKYFNLILLGDDVKVNKPNKQFYDIILKKFKVKPNECIMFGDKPEVDLKLSKKLGMATVWIRHGAWADELKNVKFNYVDYVFNDFKELNLALKNLNIN